MVAFAFGLIHGLGFASVLADLGLQGGTLALALIGFNAGVEVGQLVIVLALVPLAYALRATVVFYLARLHACRVPSPSGRSRCTGWRRSEPWASR